MPTFQKSKYKSEREIRNATDLTDELEREYQGVLIKEAAEKIQDKFRRTREPEFFKQVVLELAKRVLDGSNTKPFMGEQE